MDKLTSKETTKENMDEGNMEKKWMLKVYMKTLLDGNEWRGLNWAILFRFIQPTPSLWAKRLSYCCCAGIFICAFLVLAFQMISLLGRHPMLLLVLALWLIVTWKCLLYCSTLTICILLSLGGRAVTKHCDLIFVLGFLLQPSQRHGSKVSKSPVSLISKY